MHDDMMYEDEGVKEATRRLPKNLYKDRMFLIKRALDLTVRAQILPKEQWTKYEEDKFYPEPYLKEVIWERKEREGVTSGDDHEHSGGLVTMVSTHTVHCYDEVDLGISVQQDTGDTSSPQTMELSTGADAQASGKNLGPEARTQPPAAKSRFSLTLSRPVPGRTRDRASDSSRAPVTLDVSPQRAPENKDPSERPGLPAAAAPGPDPDKSPGRSPASGDGGSVSAQLGGGAPAKPKDSSFLDKLFKPDRGQAKAPAENNPEPASLQPPAQPADTPGPVRLCNHGSNQTDIDASEEKEPEVSPVSRSLPRDAAEDQPQIAGTENNPSIMSFFKTLVSPNKAETKKDPEDPASKAEIVCDGHVGQKTAQIQAKGSKKKQLQSPRLGQACRKLFRQKGTEKSPTTTTDLKSDKVSCAPQDTPRGAAKNPPSTEPAKEGTKEKGAPTSLPLGKLFWKKSGRESPVPPGTEENVVCESPVEAQASQELESDLDTVDLGGGAEAAPEPAEAKLKREERKPSRTSLRAFFRQMSVKGDGGTSHSEDTNAKDASSQVSDLEPLGGGLAARGLSTPSSCGANLMPTRISASPRPPAMCQTSISAEKVVMPPGPSEPAAATPKGKEGPSKDKKTPTAATAPAAAETNKPKGNKQEARAPTPEPAGAAANALQNGGGHDSPRRPEKWRQPLGGFFKSLGPKRMSDAQVQTDPVSIGPAGKSKCWPRWGFSRVKKKKRPLQDQRC
ncbi:breast carcinoma-amplified sequence 1 [Sorex fumeus]|uniref:breast carcinoma-amplified sequence 1 n=1 Tax=Sorex fumeus TaxID=62283 RepID=UPI0024AD53E4|nr:breast carcinoma-amplified sequence 1 [Sorex fumeus]